MTLLAPKQAGRKKQLGQYFTGPRVGRLLAELADAESAKTIIDPMVGSADLLVSCLAAGARPERIVGVELDPIAIAEAKAALTGVAGAELLLSDAFSAKLPDEQFDLVITNPPYIRYQAKRDVDGVEIPSGETVRTGLVRAIESREGLTTAVRTRLLRAAFGYPGTADIAVPAWILSASLVREGGVLAVVAPQAWLSRNYAHVVRELLDDMFDVEVIVEDGDASWFEDAQVRTHLVVARHRASRPQSQPRSIIRARATRELDSGGSLRGSMPSERDMVAALRAITSGSATSVTTGLSAHVERDLLVAAKGQAGHVPLQVAAALGTAPGTMTRTLESYGWRAGQGLRTGANDFFYVTENDGPQPARRWALNALSFPRECLLPAVRRQSDLGPQRDVADEASLTARVLYLQGWVTAADAKRLAAPHTARILPPDVARWIARVAKTPFSDSDGSKLFPELAAVAPNARSDRSAKPIAFWYQLPELAPRHRPAVFLPRVCGGQPAAYANSVGAVVDANFASLWPVTSDALPADALLALLNSAWTWANLEASCTVLGGGALKVEATDLRRLPLPDLTAADIERLSACGRTLRTQASDEALREIDTVVSSVLAPAATATSGLRELAERSLQHRSRR